MKRKNRIDGISIRSFVSHYLGTEHECAKLKHQGLKSFNNPYVVGVSNDFALKYPDSVMRHELIVVIDDYGNPGTYLNPNNIKKLIELETCKEKLKLLENISCHNFDEAALLYQIYMGLVKEVAQLEAFYGGMYELLYLIDKIKLLINIRRVAKEEAKRTLIFTGIKNRLKTADVVTAYEEESLDFTEEDTTCEVLPDNSLDEYHVNTKLNRQKRLDNLKYRLRER